jgi:hypothetical protein
MAYQGGFQCSSLSQTVKWTSSLFRTSWAANR